MSGSTTLGFIDRHIVAFGVCRPSVNLLVLSPGDELQIGNARVNLWDDSDQEAIRCWCERSSDEECLGDATTRVVGEMLDGV